MTCSAHDWHQSIESAASFCMVGLTCAACQAAFILTAAAVTRSGGERSCPKGMSESSAMPGYVLIANVDRALVKAGSGPVACVHLRAAAGACRLSS